MNTDIAAFQSALPGHSFEASVQPDGSVKFFDTANGQYVEVAEYAATSVQSQYLHIDASGNVTQTGAKTFYSFTFEGDEGQHLAHNLCVLQQQREHDSNSQTVSVIDPLALPGGASVAVQVYHADGAKHTIVYYIVNLRAGTTATLFNPYDGKTFAYPGNFGFPPNLRSDLSGVMTYVSATYRGSGIEGTETRDVEYALNVASDQIDGDASGTLTPGATMAKGISASRTADGNPVTAAAYGFAADATPFTFDEAVVTVTQ